MAGNKLMSGSTGGARCYVRPPLKNSIKWKNLTWTPLSERYSIGSQVKDNEVNKMHANNLMLFAIGNIQLELVRGTICHVSRNAVKGPLHPMIPWDISRDVHLSLLQIHMSYCSSHPTMFILTANIDTWYVHDIHSYPQSVPSHSTNFKGQQINLSTNWHYFIV